LLWRWGSKSSDLLPSLNFSQLEHWSCGCGENIFTKLN
jgi:hypothetical protein